MQRYVRGAQPEVGLHFWGGVKLLLLTGASTSLCVTSGSSPGAWVHFLLGQCYFLIIPPFLLWHWQSGWIVLFDGCMNSGLRDLQVSIISRVSSLLCQQLEQGGVFSPFVLRMDNWKCSLRRQSFYFSMFPFVFSVLGTACAKLQPVTQNTGLSVTALTLLCLSRQR